METERPAMCRVRIIQNCKPKKNAKPRGVPKLILRWFVKLCEKNGESSTAGVQKKAVVAHRASLLHTSRRLWWQLGPRGTL